MKLQPMRPEDWPAVRAIYEAGIATGNATFETSAPEWPAWDAVHLTDHRLVARDDDDRVIGWIALAAVSDRCAYAGWPRTASTSPPRPRGDGSGGS